MDVELYTAAYILALVDKGVDIESISRRLKTETVKDCHPRLYSEEDSPKLEHQPYDCHKVATIRNARYVIAEHIIENLSKAAVDEGDK